MSHGPSPKEEMSSLGAHRDCQLRTNTARDVSHREAASARCYAERYTYLPGISVSSLHVSSMRPLPPQPTTRWAALLQFHQTELMPNYLNDLWGDTKGLSYRLRAFTLLSVASLYHPFNTYHSLRHDRSLSALTACIVTDTPPPGVETVLLVPGINSLWVY